MVFPVPAGVPVQLPVNHCQAAPVPRLPPLTVSVVVAPAQSVLLPDVDIDPGAELLVLTFTVVDTHDVFPQVPSARR